MLAVEHVGFNNIIQNENGRKNKISRHSVTRKLKRLSEEIDDMLLDLLQDVSVGGTTTDAWIA